MLSFYLLSDDLINSMDSLRYRTVPELARALKQNGVDDELKNHIHDEILERGHVGLVNPNVMCYMNSVLQSLFVLKDFTRLVEGYRGDRAHPSWCDLAEQFDMMQRGIFEGVSAVEPKRNALFRAPNWQDHWRAGGQQDAVEYFEALYAKLLGELARPEREILPRIDNVSPANYVHRFEEESARTLRMYPQIYRLPLERMFFAVVARRIQCEACHYSTTLFEIEAIKKIAVQRTLEEGLLQDDHHTYPEWRCLHCNQIRIGIGSKKILSPAPILMIQLLRFKNDGGRQVKNDAIVTFPILLEYQEAQYNLKSVVYHSGSLNGGHYTAWARCNRGWFSFNDNHVTKECIVPPSWGSATPYMFFYERVEAAV